MRASAKPRIVVAGTAGGVGTTTVAALIARQIGAIDLLDHSGGGLAARGAVDGVTGGGTRELLDLGAHALDSEALHAPTAIPVIVTAATPIGISLAKDLRRSFPSSRPALMVLVETFGRHDLGSARRMFSGEIGRGATTMIPQDRALSPGGPIPHERISARTRDEIIRLVGRIERY